MAKKKQKSRQKDKGRGWLIDPKQIDRWLDDAVRFMASGDFERVIKTCQRILKYVPAKATERALALGYIGNAFAMLKEFEESFQAFTKALEVEPDDPYYLYDRGQSALFTSRSGQAYLDLQRAAELIDDPDLLEQCKKHLEMARTAAESHRAMGGPDFSLEDLVAQEDLFRQGMRELEAGEYVKAEATMRRVIGMADRLPQPRGNLALALLMQQRYDEAEEQLRQALELDPEYELARRNLAMLPQLRRTGETPQVAVSDPMRSVRTTQSVVFK